MMNNLMHGEEEPGWHKTISLENHFKTLLLPKQSMMSAVIIILKNISAQTSSMDLSLDQLPQ
jgi:hypothetical protein